MKDKIYYIMHPMLIMGKVQNEMRLFMCIQIVPFPYDIQFYISSSWLINAKYSWGYHFQFCAEI